MAKGQKRNNRETRKPKADKPASVAAPTTLLAKAMAPVSGGVKRKG
jgi:hypothetical protein